MTESELAAKFLSSFSLHEVMHQEEIEGFAVAAAPKDPFEAAAHILRAQAAARIESDIELICNARGPSQDISRGRRTWDCSWPCSSPAGGLVGMWSSKARVGWPAIIATTSLIFRSRSGPGVATS